MTILLHGFWGQPSDWNAVMQRLPLSASVWTPDLYADEPLQPHHKLNEWTENFVTMVRDGFTEPVQLVGYSMGGRLAVNALVKAPELFSRALILSAAPFMPEPAPEREAWERDWMKRFQTQPWDELETGWQEQGVFAGSQMLPRRKTPQMREMVGLSLTNWSVRLHPFGPEAVKALSNKVEWAFGALDQKYVNFAKLLQELPVRGQISVIENAGHRLNVDAADFVASWIERSAQADRPKFGEC